MNYNHRESCARMYNKLMEIRDEADYSPEESCTIQEAEQFYAVPKLKGNTFKNCLVYCCQTIHGFK